MVFWRLRGLNLKKPYTYIYIYISFILFDFQSYKQADPGHYRRYEGPGADLVTCRHRGVREGTGGDGTQSVLTPPPSLGNTKAELSEGVEQPMRDPHSHEATDGGVDWIAIPGLAAFTVLLPTVADEGERVLLDKGETKTGGEVRRPWTGVRFGEAHQPKPRSVLPVARAPSPGRMEACSRNRASPPPT